MTENRIRKNYDALMSVYHKLGLDVAGDVRWIAWLSGAEKRLHKMAENACNYALTKAGETRQANIAADIKECVEAALPALKGLVYINGDSRGHSIKIDPYTKCGTGPHIADPEVDALMRDCGILRDWGGYGILDPAANL